MSTQIVTADESHYGSHGAHVTGVSAMLSSDNSPFDLRQGARLFQLANSLLLKGPLQVRPDCCVYGSELLKECQRTRGLRVLCAPVSNPSAEGLDALLVKLNPVLWKAGGMLSVQSVSLGPKELETLKQEILSLDEEFRQWPMNQPSEWTPRTIGSIEPKTERSTSGARFWSGKIDTYFDREQYIFSVARIPLTITVYVSAVWNAYRKTRLLLLNQLYINSMHLGDESDHRRAQAEAQELVESIVASIPYHVLEDPEALLLQAGRCADQFKPGRPVAGLLLMHPLYVTSMLPVVSPPLCAHLRECLGWIGQNMGIGQATLLSKVSS